MAWPRITRRFYSLDFGNHAVFMNTIPFFLKTDRFGFETASSGVSKCAMCKENILKGDLRGYYYFKAPQLFLKNSKYRHHPNPKPLNDFNMRRFFCRDCMNDCLKTAKTYYRSYARDITRLAKAWKRSQKGKRVTKIDNAAKMLLELEKNGNEQMIIQK